MSKILKNKLLASALSFNRDLAIFTKPSKNLFDLLKFVDKDSLTKWIKNPNEKTLLISKVKNIQSILNGIETLSDYKEVKQYFETYNIHITKKLLSLLEKDFRNYIDEAKELFYKELTSFNEKFIKLAKSAKEKEIESSVWSLNVGVYYLSGVTSDSKKFNAPLVVIPVKIERNKNDMIEIKKLSNQYKSNTKLNFLLNHYYDVEIDEFESDNLEDFNIYYEKINRFLAIDSSNPFDKPLVEFVNKPDENKEYIDPLEFNNFVTLSLFDADGGKILKDVKEIFERTNDPFKMGNIIKDEKYVNEIIDLDNLIAINNKLNIYQKYAIKSALNENTLIYGPPGTGKSETIASLIANILYLNKNVLMVSEKKAALDVVVNRLGDLKHFALNIYDNKNKSNFYNKIKELLDLLNNHNIDIGFNYYHTIKMNDNVLLNNLKETYNIENDISNLKLPDIESYLKDNGNFIKTRIDIDKIERILDLMSLSNNQNKSEEVLEKIEKLKLFINEFNKLDEFKENILENKYLKFNKDSFKEFKHVYESTKDKYKSFTLNNYLNNGTIKKGNLFRHKLNKYWTIFEYEILDKIEELFKYSPMISKKIIDRTKEILSLSNNICSNDLDIYFNFIILKNVINKYPFSYCLDINKKIKLYEQNSNINASNNLEQILKWYVNETRKKIDACRNNWYYPELEKQMKNIFKVAQRKNFPSVASFIKSNYHALKMLFPIWIMSPNEVSINLPNNENIFDYGIFDEASQMFVEHSIPSIYRCKNVCVAGDDKQLKPTNFFATKLNYSDEDLEDEEFAAESLLDKAKESLWYEFNLKNHYRSKNANLIKFSNEHIYNNELETATINGNFENWIEVFDVNGVWDDRRNSVEIDSILDYLEQNYTNQEYLDSTSYLIVTFNQSQKDELESRFANRLAMNYEHFKRAYENNLLKFRNIENVQGDEADYVIFSCTYAKNKDNKFIQNFGPLMQDNGPNRLNVALTRAKEKMIVFKSFYGYEITNHSNNKNTEIFKKFISFMDSIKSNFEKSNFNTSLLNEPLEFDSNFEKVVYEELNSRINKDNFKILTQFKVGSKRIDQVIWDIKQNKVVLGIEVDGIRYHSGYRKILEDIDRQYFLENRGYKIYRVKEFDWLSNQNQVIDQIIKSIL